MLAVIGRSWCESNERSSTDHIPLPQLILGISKYRASSSLLCKLKTLLYDCHN